MPTPTVGATGRSEVVGAPGSGPRGDLGPVRVCTRAGRPARGGGGRECSACSAGAGPIRSFVLQFSGGDPSVGAQARHRRRRHRTRDETPLAIDDQDDDTRLYLGPARSADLLEVVTILRADGSELVIHAMKLRPKYRRLLPER